MQSLLIALTVGSLLSSVSLMIVLFRVSPLTAERPAVIGLFVTLCLTICTVSTLLLFFFWKKIPWHHWDDGTMLNISFRQACFIAASLCLLLAFHLLGIFTWWIGMMVLGIFILVELALHL